MKTEKIFFESDGEKICGVMTLPDKSQKKYSFVILCHGFTSNKDSGTYAYLQDELSKKGILSLRMDFSGHGESEGKFEDITISKGCNNILSAINHIKKLGYVKKIALFGTSFGGVCSVIAASKTNALRALALKCPALEMGEKRREKLGPEGIKKWKEKGYIRHINNACKETRLNYSFYEDAIHINSYRVAKKINAPTFIIHGDKDKSVPVQQAKKLAKIIKNSRLEIIKGASHHFDNPGEREKINKMFLDFLEDKLK